MAGSAGSGAGAMQEWRRHWLVVLAAVMGAAWSSIPPYGLGILFGPLEQMYGWNRAAISAGMTIYATVTVLGDPLGGYVVDRFGARRVGIAGVILFAGSYSLFALITPSIWSWWGLWVVFGTCSIFAKPQVWAKAVTSFFSAGRGLALGCMISGGALSAAFLPNLGLWLMARFGVHGVFPGIALVFLVVTLPFLLVGLYDAGDRKFAKTGGRGLSRREVLKALPGWTEKEGLRRREFYQIAAAAFIGSAAVTGLAVHAVPILMDAGVTKAQAAGMFSMLALFAVFARLTFGYIFDRVPYPAICALSIAMSMLPALVLLLLPHTTVTLMLAVALIGLALGGEYDAVIYLSSRYFGLKSFGFLFGIVVSCYTLGVGVGPVLAGWAFDATGSYTPFLIATIPAGFTAALLVITLRRYPVHPHEEIDEALAEAEAAPIAAT